MAVADNEAEAHRRGDLVAGYLRTGSMVYPPFKNPPGYFSVDDTAKLMRGFVPERSFTKDRRVVDMRTGSVQDLIDYPGTVTPSPLGFDYDDVPV